VLGRGRGSSLTRDINAVVASGEQSDAAKVTGDSPNTATTSAEAAPPPRLGKNLLRGMRIAWQASPRYFLAAIGIAAVTAAVRPLELWLTKNLVDAIALGESHAAIAVVPTVILLGILFGASYSMMSFRRFHQEMFGRRVERHIMRTFLDKASSVDMGHFDDPAWHDAATRARRDVQWIPGQMMFMTLELIATTLGMLGMLGLLLSMHPAIAALLLCCLVPWIAVERRIAKRIFAFHTSHTPADRERDYMATLLAEISTAKEVRSFGLASHLLDRFTHLNDQLDDELRALYRNAQLISLALSVFSALVIGAAYWFIADASTVRQFTAGDVVAAIGAFATIAGQAHMMSHQLGLLERHAAFLEHYFTFLAVEPLVPVAPSAATLPATLPAGIRVEGVHFTYPHGTKEALTGLDFEVRPGELVAIVGENGAGKTTLVNLLSRFYDPVAGRISIGGVDLRELDPIEVRSRIGVLLQDFAKYQLTLRDNVRFGRIDRACDDAAVIDSLDAARSKFLLDAHPNALDARLGRLFDGGHELSGGEWQRVAIARLMFRRADVWILDEPTSNLDPAAEAAIFAELKQQLAGRMAIVISHRFSTVRVADRIYVIDGGRVLESGTHTALLAAKGRYAELFELQAAGYR
jgi:ATP-binding cassette subfamily B protein